MFLGGNTINLDAKGRLAFPTRFRDELTERCGGQVVLTVAKDRCLSLYPRPDWDELQRKLVRLPNQNPRALNMQRLIFGYATELEIDKTGRILIPPRLREFAKLGKRVVLCGQVNKFEIWNEEDWDRKLDEWTSEDGDSGALPDYLENLSI